MSAENKHRRRSLRRISRNFDDDTVDPRIKDELECLNNASEDINKFELLVEVARDHFRQLMTNSTYQLNGLAQKIGVNCIDKGRPFYEARNQAKGALKDSQQAAVRYEWAISTHNAAREMVHVAERGFYSDQNRHDSSWQEMLNHATHKVTDAEMERITSETDHKNTALVYNELDMKTKALQKKLKSSIKKSKPYFDMHAMFNRILEDQKSSVQSLERGLKQAKSMYSGALKSLEKISEEIHERRRECQRLMMAERECGVGAEADDDGDDEDEILESNETSPQRFSDCSQPEKPSPTEIPSEVQEDNATPDDSELGFSNLAIQFPNPLEVLEEVRSPEICEASQGFINADITEPPPPSQKEPVRRKLPVPPQASNSPTTQNSPTRICSADKPPDVVIRRKISGPVTAQHKLELRNLIHRLSQIVTDDYQSDDDKMTNANRNEGSHDEPRPAQDGGSEEKFSSLTLSSSKVFHCTDDNRQDISIVSMNEGIFTNIGTEIKPPTADERPTPIGQSDSESNISHLQLNDKLYVPYLDSTDNAGRLNSNVDQKDFLNSGSSGALSSDADNSDDYTDGSDGISSSGSYVVSQSDENIYPL